MRSVLDFYRARPLTAVVVAALGLAIAIATAQLQDGGGVILPIVFVVVLGLVVGTILALAQRRRDAGE